MNSCSNRSIARLPAYSAICSSVISLESWLRLLSLLLLVRGDVTCEWDEAWKDEARRVGWEEDLASSLVLLRRECSDLKRSPSVVRCKNQYKD